MATEIIPLKRCSRKSECVHPESKDGWLPLLPKYWHRDKTSSDGFCYSCKECAKARSRKWVADNPEQNKTNCLNYYYSNQDQVQEYRENHRQEECDYKRDWRKKNPDKTKKHKSDSQKRNRDSANIRSRRYLKRNPDKVRERTRINLQRRRRAEGKYTKADIDALFEEQNGLCCFCGIRLFRTIKNDVWVEHIIPIKRGGTHWPDNLMLSCGYCNQSKGDKLLSEWEIARGW